MTLSVSVSAEVVKLSTGATLDLHTPDAAKANGRAVIVCPGGGYSYLAIAAEGTDWIPFYTELGYTVGVLSYRMPNGQHDVPLTDGRAAMKYIRDNADALGVNPSLVGVMGFSAGGHLASTIATHTEGEERPAFQILFYPVITMQSGKTHQGSIDCLLGSNPSAELVELYSNEKQVNGMTPPAFITYSENDGTVVPATNAVAYYNALTAVGVPVKMQSYEKGGHGWGFSNAKFAWHTQLHQLLTEWLEGLDELLNVERFPDVETYTVPAEAETIDEKGIPYLYPNLSTVVINSSAIASTNYKEKTNLMQYFGNTPTRYEFGEGITIIGRYILTGASAVTSLNLPSTLQTIGMHAFNKTGLETVELPEGLTSIEVSAFANTNLTNVVLPEGLTQIGASAFRNCTSLESITLPASLESLPNYLVSGCTALTTIKCMRRTPPTAANYMTDTKLYPSITLYVPAGTKELYAADAVWSKVKEIVEFEDETPVNAPTYSLTPANTAAYSIDGRRLSASHRGIAIVGGRKVMQ